MTILAGAFSRHAGVSLPNGLCDALPRAISRHPCDQVTVFRDERCLLAKVDIGAYGEPAFRKNALGSVVVLAGEPLLSPGYDSASRSRTEDLHRLHDAWDREDWSSLAWAQGVFCAAHYSPTAGCVTLLTDKLGVRPIYFWTDARYMVFASALRILEAVREVPKEMSLIAVTELATLGFPLGDRTPYAGIRVLHAGEVVQIAGANETHTRYWRWDGLGETRLSEPELLSAAAQRFSTAIARRLRRDTATIAFLTGGLDSRSVVACLRERGAVVHTVHFARLRRTQDQMFAELFAERARTIHRDMRLDPVPESQLTALGATAWDVPPESLEQRPERPRLVWSGDGGSVSLGHVYMSRAISEEMRAGRRDAAIATFLREQGTRVIHRLLNPGVAASLRRLPAEGIAAELDSIHCTDPARTFHLFLMLNDQRRHFASHFEDIDLHRLEFHVPFFDGGFLELILAAPVDLCLCHHLYGKWLSHLPAMVTAVPWQTYPGHEPCPLPAPPNLRYQWDQESLRTLTRLRRESYLRKAREILDARDFPSAILRKDRCRLVYWLMRARLRDYGYAIKFADVYYRHWARSGGTFSLLPAQ